VGGQVLKPIEKERFCNWPPLRGRENENENVAFGESLLEDHISWTGHLELTNLPRWKHALTGGI